jgi:rod shape determining protein RodA
VALAQIAYRARHRFDMLLAAGVTALFAWYTLVNLGMTMGLTPVVGVPLPFMSYGGSSVVAGFAAVGILMNVRFRRFRIFDGWEALSGHGQRSRTKCGFF